VGNQFNYLKFMNNFTKLYSDHFKYLKLKAQKKMHMAKIEELICGDLEATDDLARDKVESLKLRIKEKREKLA
jgi:hypothetical protein